MCVVIPSIHDPRLSTPLVVCGRNSREHTAGGRPTLFFIFSLLDRPSAVLALNMYSVRNRERGSAKLVAAGEQSVSFVSSSPGELVFFSRPPSVDSDGFAL